MKYLYHLLKIPFILLWILIVHCICFKEFGIIQVIEPYMMDIQRIYIYSILLGFFIYGLYAALRDVILLIKEDGEIKDG